MSSTQSVTRANPQIWRLAKWLHDTSPDNIVLDKPEEFNNSLSEIMKNYWYDYAKQVTYRIMYSGNEFTGVNNHD